MYIFYFHAKDQLLWILKTYSLFNLNPSNCELQIKESGLSFQQYCKSCNSLEILPKRACEPDLGPNTLHSI